MKKALVAGLVLLIAAVAATIRPSGNESTESNVRDPTIRAAPATKQKPIVIQSRPREPQSPFLLPRYFYQVDDQRLAPTI